MRFPFFDFSFRFFDREEAQEQVHGAVFEKLKCFTINRARRHGGQLVLDAVMAYFTSFEACIFDAENPLDAEGALITFETETDTPSSLAARILSILEACYKFPGLPRGGGLGSGGTAPFRTH